MPQPTWITPAGSLGTIPEGVFYSVQVYALADVQTVFYRLIAGSLPEGVQFKANGAIEGIPFRPTVQGVPAEVLVDVTSKFVVRAYTTTNNLKTGTIDRFIDRTFTLTVSDQNFPEFVTPPGNIGTFYDGTAASIQLSYTGLDPGELPIISLVSGELPKGLTLNPNTGTISGIILPLEPLPGTPEPGFDATPFDAYPYSFSRNSPNRNFEFTLNIASPSASETLTLRTFSIYVYSKTTMVADTTDITADTTFVTADVINLWSPIVTNYPTNGSIGTYRHDNFFAYQVEAIDFNGDPIEFEFVAGELPPNLQLDPLTGWIYGYLAQLGAIDIDYNFSIRVRKSNYAELIANTYTYNLNVVGAIENQVTWITGSDLGTINNGDVSTLSVRAATASGIPLQYRLDSGINPGPVYNKLPQGLTLLPSGNIAGRVSFNTFALDGGTTTFDEEKTTRLTIDPTTFDSTYTFTVNAYSSDGLISVYKTFTVFVNRAYNKPYNNLYVKAMPPLNDRALVSQLIENSDIFKPEYIYRKDDPNFGVAKSVVYWHAYGLNADTYENYISSLYINHYWKNLVLGQIETAQALDDNGNVLYEVVYSRVIDNQVNSRGQSVSKEITLPYPVDFYQNSTLIEQAYPNSLVNMRDQVIDTVGKVSEILPRWMFSKQTNGQVLGFVPAWVICYCNPGRSREIAYLIQQQFGTQLNKVDYEVDRYELDRLLSIHWDSETQQWTPPGAETTFDVDLHYEVTSFSPGVDYSIGDEITIDGTAVGGISGLNNIVIKVADIDQYGGITDFFVTQSTAPLLSLGEIYAAIGGTVNSGPGNGASFDLEVASGTTTTFDGTSMRFEAPVDNYSNTDAFDKYLMFPRRNILV